MEKLDENYNCNCKPKIVNYFIECENLNYEYNCELCDKEECPHWVEFNRP